MGPVTQAVAVYRPEASRSPSAKSLEEQQAEWVKARELEAAQIIAQMKVTPIFQRNGAPCENCGNPKCVGGCPYPGAGGDLLSENNKFVRQVRQMAEAGPGIVAMPSEPAPPDYSGWVHDIDLIPDAD